MRRWEPAHGEHDFDWLLICRRCGLTREATYQLRNLRGRCRMKPWENNVGSPPRRPELLDVEYPTAYSEGR